jgi:exodeoxyribonuclease V alpha subunit
VFLKMSNHTDHELAFTEIDRHFAALMMRLVGKEDRRLWFAAALASHVTQEGHVCLDLARVAGQPSGHAENEQGTTDTYPSLVEWIGVLRQCRAVGSPGEFRPLILTPSNRLYLYRYWQYEKRLADFIRARRGLRCLDVNALILQEGVNRLFPRSRDEAPNGQRVAALAAVERMFSVITGGPGTGKTSTVVRILALLLEQSGGEPIDIALTAPTGKAAAKLKEAVRSAKETLDCPLKIRQAIPEETSTLHRLLGTIPGSARFRFDEKNRLPHRVVVVDEASMVDLPLMAKLTQAISDNARLILLGDRDQLASVEPGAVFGDICEFEERGTEVGEPNSASRAPTLFMDARSKAGPVEQSPSIVILRKSFRFSQDSGIQRLSEAVNSGNGDRALALLEDGASPDLAWHDVPAPALMETHLESKIVTGYRNYSQAPSVEEAFREFGRFQILCALRRGPYGAVSVGETVERVLNRAGLIDPRGRWYHGEPVMINENDYSMKLFNGDLGIVFASVRPGEMPNSGLRAFFARERGVLWSTPPLRLPAHEIAYAMTVHKSQGSEFDEVLLILPDVSSPVLTRELIYTGITRAKKRVEIWGRADVFREAVSRRHERTSGLKEALRV